MNKIENVKRLKEEIQKAIKIYEIYPESPLKAGEGYTAEDLEDADVVVFKWLMFLSPEERCIVWKKALKQINAEIAFETGYSKRKVKCMYKRAIEKLFDKLKSKEEVSEVVLSDCMLKDLINDTSFVKNLTHFLIKE